MDEKIPLKQFSGGVAKDTNPFDLYTLAPEATAAFTAALQHMSQAAGQAGAAISQVMLRYPVITAPDRIVIWEDVLMDIENAAVRPQPKRVDMRGFSEVEL
jgi:polysaccharide deacetylase 2 family uncharacterized protein YibQ